MRIFKVLPELKKTRQLNLWHKALRSQWSAADLNWNSPQRITSDCFKDHLARVLTPILMGEQSALYSVSGLIPKLGQRMEVESQFYLTTWAVDEARHTELFTLFYRRLNREPLSIRTFPAGYLFQSQIVSGDAAEWLSGVLVSEVLAKLVMEEFLRLDLDPVLSEIANGILADEARHLGFNHIYLEDRFSNLFRKDAKNGASFGDFLRQRMRHVLSYIPPIFNALNESVQVLGIDHERLYQRLEKEALQRLDKSIACGEKNAQRQVEASNCESDAALDGSGQGV